MKKVLFIIGLTLFINGCKTISIPVNAELKETAPFEVVEGFYMKTGKQEYKVTLLINSTDGRPKTIYFKGLHANLTSKDNLNFTAYLKPEKLGNDLILHEDPKKEFGNKPPSFLRDQQKYRLAKNKALILFDYQGVSYFIEKVIKQKK